MQESEIIDRIKALCAARGWTFYRLAKQSGITYSTLCTMLHKATAPSFSTLVKICRGFDISLSEFFDTDNDWATLSIQEKEHLRHWNTLSKQDQYAVEKYILFLMEQQTKKDRNELPLLSE